jgi:xylan 1,4-beta-xylosidase
MSLRDFMYHQWTRLNTKSFRNVQLFVFLVLIVWSSISCTAMNPKIHPTDQNVLTIDLDCTKTTGIIRPFSDINSGPLPIHTEPRGVDLTQQYQDIGITFIRTHDFYGPTDISSIFPNETADPSLPSSYNFTASDPFITGIINAECHVFYRLGESASGNESLRTPPTNHSKWAEICKHIVMHYNDGWNNGYYYNITYWEIWNEPDLPGFWKGTADEYYHLYHTTVETLKAYNPSLKIGGPCTSSITNTNFTSGFLNYIIDHNLPLDFYSWHRYADTPNELFSDSRQIRNLLDSYGLNDCENINTEWNIDILGPQRDKDNAKNAAFTTCSLTSFQDAGIDYAFRYRGTGDSNWLSRLIGFDLSLFTYDGLYKTPALSYTAMHYMIRDSPLRLTTPEMDAATGVTYLAGIANDGSNLSILISNFDTSDTDYVLTLDHLPFDTDYTVVYYRIDDNHHLQITNASSAKGSTFTTVQKLESNSVHFLRLTTSSIIPPDGPVVAEIPLLLRLRCLDPFTQILALLLILLIFS